MAKAVNMGSLMTCSFGTVPSALVVTPENMTQAEYTNQATIMDHVPMKNIMSFGMCTTVSNPTVATATTAALGVLTPMPCIPATASPWVPGATTVMIGNYPALNNSSKCNCTWGGVISITKQCVQTDVP